MHDNSICNLYALPCWQNFIFAKSGCYTQGKVGFGIPSWLMAAMTAIAQAQALV
jgi:hypothetical protein